MRLTPSTVALVGIFVFVLALIACGASSGTSSEATQEAATGCDPRFVPAAEAGQHFGEEVTVCGLVKNYDFRDTGTRPTFILFDQSGPARLITGGGRGLGGAELNISFTVLILGKDKSNFPVNFGSFYTGKMICATGLIEKLPQGAGRFSEDNPAIVAQSSSQIDVDCKAQSTDR